MKPTQSLQKTSSWIIKNKITGEVVLETFNQKILSKINSQKYEIVPILKHLQSLTPK